MFFVSVKNPNPCLITMNTSRTASTPSMGLFARIMSFAAFLSGPLVGVAASVSFTSTLPTQDVLTQNTSLSATASIQVRNLSATNERWVGVGFTAPTNASLDRVTFYIAFNTENVGLVNSSALGATMKIDVVALDSLTGTPSVPYTTIHSETAVLPAAYGNELYLTFDLATSVALTATQNYGVMLSFTDFANSRGINLRQSPGGTAGTNGIGSLFYTTDDGATYTTGSPVAFVLQTAAVPEPSSSAFLFGGVGLAVVALRRRRRSGRN